MFRKLAVAAVALLVGIAAAAGSLAYSSFAGSARPFFAAAHDPPAAAPGGRRQHQLTGAGLGGGAMTRTRVIAVASAKGSPGCSFVALGLAGRLAEGGVETLLVDADGEAAGSLLTVLGLLRGGDAPLLGGLGPVTVAAVEGAALAAGRGLRCLDLSGEPRA